MKLSTQAIALIATLTTLGFSANAATNQFSVTASSTVNYTINGVDDPALTLVRGFTYTFNISVSGIHPFYIKTAQVTGSGSQYNDGVSAQGVTSGTITFDVPNGAPDTLHYQCSNHFNMHGLLHIVDSPDVGITAFNVGTNVVIQSTGTDALNINVLTSTNLTSNTVWEAATVQSNAYANGTNTTTVVPPTGDAAFFQVEQGF